MNLNKKIRKFTGDGIPEYNKALNELIDAVNWLAGIRAINGKAIVESDQGPILDLSQVNTTQPANDPSATDPDGNQAGWRKISLINTVTGNYFDTWAWSGAVASNIRPVPWLFDPSANQAGWIICPSHNFWGTGQCSDTTGYCPNFTNEGRTLITPGYGNNPWICDYPAEPGVISPPHQCTPRVYFVAASATADGCWTGSGIGPPCFQIGTGLPPSPPTTYNWTISIIYDGVLIFQESGINTWDGIQDHWLDCTLNPANWLYDPSGLPGYSHGSGYWVYPYNGSFVSSNPNPIIRFKISFSGNIAAAPVNEWHFVFMEGS